MAWDFSIQLGEECTREDSVFPTALLLPVLKCKTFSEQHWQQRDFEEDSDARNCRWIFHCNLAVLHFSKVCRGINVSKLSEQTLLQTAFWAHQGLLFGMLWVNNSYNERVFKQFFCCFGGVWKGRRFCGSALLRKLSLNFDLTQHLLRLPGLVI